jgi:hypothetical protein
MTYFPSCGRPVRRESGQQCRQILARERPLERARGSFVPVLEPEQGGFERGEVGEVAGRQYLRWTTEKSISI